MSNEELHVDWKKLKQMGWYHSPRTTNRMVSKGRFPKPFRFGATDYRAVWRLRGASLCSEALPSTTLTWMLL